jgi:predicted outer membrane repeat protein
MKRLFRRQVWFLLVLSGLCIGNVAKATDGVVSTCEFDNPMSSTDFNSVFNAVNDSGGGTITFSCTGTITFGFYERVSGEVVIDGGNKVVFDGGGTSAFFQIYSGHSLTLKRLNMQHGASNGDGVLDNFGKLTLDTVTLQNNFTSTGMIYNSGDVNILGSTFSYNNIDGSGANLSGTVIRNVGGTVVVSSSTFSHNHIDSTSGGNGGAISNEAGGSLYVSYSNFTDNSAFDGGVIWGGNDSSGIIHVAHSTFTGNKATYGGAIENFGNTLTLNYNKFDSNQADNIGGALWSEGGVVDVNWSEFTNNTSATTGGAIHCDNNTLYVARSTFADNQSGSGGTGGTNHGGAIYSSCYLVIRQSTFRGNKAPGSGGGAIYETGSQFSEIFYSTIAANQAGYGSGMANDGSVAMLLGGSIFAGNTHGYTCAGYFSSSGYNLADDTDCGGALDEGTDQPNVALSMGDLLASTGDPTRTMLPLAGNPAINNIPAGQCIYDTDQRGAIRPSPAGGNCDSGAVEVGGIVDGIFMDGYELP